MKESLMLTAFLAACLGQVAPPAEAEEKALKPPAKLSPELAPPIRLQAAGKFIDTDVGHAAPFVGDFFGDGKKHLLVGQFGDGILWIHRNEGTKEAPKLAERIKFNGKVPTG